MGSGRQQGAVLLLLVVAIALALASLGAMGLSAAGQAQRRLATERALAQAREALVTYAADRPIDARVGPGYLPCPDLDDDGWAQSTCGSLSGHLGQAERLGRLPWKTLGLPDLRDGHGERLWYAVSSRHKGLLNCAASRACIDMTPASALGTITVRDASGVLLHDGTIAEPSRAAAGGAVAVVIAPGPPLMRIDGREQRRDCAAGDCADPRNYLDAAPFEDNAGFVDRNDADARAANSDGFVEGPVGARGVVLVNDRVAAIGYADVMARVMARVALELAHCVRGTAATPSDPCPASAHLGRLDAATLPHPPACNASETEPSWWASWKPFVLYALAAPSGLEVVDSRGRSLASGRRFAILVTQRAGECIPAQLQCDATGCARIGQPERTRERHDALVASP